MGEIQASAKADLQDFSVGISEQTAALLGDVFVSEGKIAKTGKNDLGPETHVKYLNVAIELTKRYGIEGKVKVPLTVANCCGQH